MIRTTRLPILIAVSVSGLALFGATADITSSPATPAATPVLAGDPFEVPGAIPLSLLINNDGHGDDRLLGGSTPAGERIEVHRTRLVAGRRVMQTLPDGLVVPAGATLVLEPGAHHLMLIGLRDDLVQGATFPLTLHFARAGGISLTARVRRKVDAAGITPFPPVTAGDISVSLVSAPPAPRATPESP